jgi:Cu2+-exporting ATPase/Cu+-exporting ATPase
VYFESLAVLVFLLLGSRYFLYQLQHKFLGPGHLRSFYETSRVRVVNPDTGQTEERHIDKVSENDEIVVHGGERIPVDGQLVTDEAYVNAAVLTGEPEPQRVLKNQPVFAGTQLMSGTARIRTEKVGQKTRVGNLLEEAERGVLSRTPLISLTDRVAQWFSASVLGLGIAFAVIYSFTGDIQEAINRGLALVILACPCALALATPLTQSLALKKAAKRGCLIKKADAFEKLCQVRKVFFDKTGTLTKGELELTGWWPGPPDNHERAVIHALEKDSPHPIARLLAAEVSGAATEDITLDKRKEVQGTGVGGYVGDDHYEFRSLKSQEDSAKAQELAKGSNSLVGLYRNGALIKVAALGDTIRESSADVVAGFKQEKREVYLLTGDAERPAKAIGSQVGIDEPNVLYQKSPEEKQAILKRSDNEKSLMVGDGINDSVALANAHVSVAVQGSMEASFRVADIYLTQPGLVPLIDLFRLSGTTISIIKRNLLISLVYNSVGGTLALLGFINPLVAAVLMPISSVTVVLSSVIGNRFWRRFGRRAQDEAERSAPTDVRMPSLAAKGGGA